MNSGDQFIPYYAAWRKRFPDIFRNDLIVRPDKTDGYHIESGADNGVPWVWVRAGYVVEWWQAAHEIVGHMADKLTGGRMREPYWKWRFGGYASAPQSWVLAAVEPNAIAGIWADQPVESLAEAARLAYTRVPFGGPGDRSMNWGKELDVVAARAFFREQLREVS